MEENTLAIIMVEDEHSMNNNNNDMRISVRTRTVSNGRKYLLG